MFGLACQERHNSSLNMVKCNIILLSTFSVPTVDLFSRCATMPQKRGHPMFELTDNPTLNRQRQLAAARMCDLRNCRRVARGVTTQPILL